MIIKLAISLLVSSWILVSYAKNTEFAVIDTADFSLRVPIKSWKTLRDQGIVKQDFDYSCGAASIATILNEFYGQNITEQQILDKMNDEKQRINFTTLTNILTLLKQYPLDKKSIDSLITKTRQPLKFLWEYNFEDMTKVLNEMGFKAYGIAASYQQLTQLKIPVIIYMKFRKDDHFSVLRGINQKTVWLADPSLGNRTYSQQQFLSHWETRLNHHLKGKILVILPNTEQPHHITELKLHPQYFTKNPIRQTQTTLKIMQTISNARR